MNAPSILVVEDNPLTRKMLRLTLESEGYAVAEAADGRGALAAAEIKRPDLVLQDLILPDMNGFELARQLRISIGDTTPIVGLSGFLNRVEDARDADTAFTALLVKPIEPSRLLEVLRPYFPGAQRKARLGQDCRVLVVDDDLVQLKLTRLHLEQLGFEVGVAASGAEALRLARESAPSVILSDVLMPDLDGFQLCFEVRNDPELAHVPVVLASAWYETAADRQLAARVGALALVQKTGDFKGIPDALLGAVRRKKRTGGTPREPSVEVRLEHAQAVIRQLERQVAVSQELTRRCTLQAAQIALLSGVADALAMQRDADAAVRDVLAATLDAAGISKGALFLSEERAPLTLRHAIGFSSEQRASLNGFFGRVDLLNDAIARQVTLSIPSRLQSLSEEATLLSNLEATSTQVVPLISEGRGVGAMVLCARSTDITNEDSIAFARAMGNQLAQSLDLASSFAKLTASERRYRAVTEQAHDAIAILTPEGVITEVNPSFQASLGQPREQLVGRRLQDFVSASPQDSPSNLLLPTESGTGAATTPFSIARPDGALVLMEFTSRLVDVGGEKLVVSIGRDVTERVQTQAQLMFSDRMVSIGTLAAGVAHEINNPLTATICNLEFGIEQCNSPAATLGGTELDALRGLLEDAMEGAERVRRIVRDLKIFSRAEEDERGPVVVERVLESSLRMARNEIHHRAELVRQYAEIPPVEGSESRLGQVFLNLIVNAVQALPEGHANENRIWVRTRLDAAARVVVEVEDTGPGIPREVLARLFTPFFTTKPSGVGTGLGLSICKRIVTNFGGSIEVESVLGRGTLFRVILPQAKRGELLKAAMPRQRTNAPRRGRVLIIDDDEMTARVVAHALSAEHDVLVASDVDQALGRIMGGMEFDVVICDLMMPVKTGVDFYERLHEHSPEAASRVIFLTGGAFTVKAREFLTRVSNACMEKPFEIQALRALVNERCGSDASQGLQRDAGLRQP